MSNNINWGKIYESTAWGSGVTDNNISWGKSYADLAGGGGTPFVGLLDTYSGAAAAYSLRQLSSTYSGNAIKVRRASDNAEQDIAFANNELDTATLESFASGTDAFVTTWYDQSGSGNNATQTTASSQPKIVSSGSTINDNGKPSLEFLGNQDIEFSNLVNDDQDSLSLFGIGSFDSLIAEGAFYDLTSEGPDFRYCLSYNREGNGLFSNRLMLEGITYYEGSDDALSAANQYLFSSVQTGFYIDSVSNTTERSGRITALNNSLTIGSRSGSYHHDGKISEVIVYLSNESANRTGIETNINDFYSIY